jgi:hypothetical protein
MVLSAADRRAKLEQLAQIEGFATVEQMLQEAVLDGVSPGICVVCDYTTEVEPDQRQGWCENCGAGLVSSALILAGFV